MASFDTPIPELIAACSRPESPDAWDELIRRFGSYIRKIVYELTEILEVAQCHDLRQELVQEVYCRLLEKRRRYLRQFRGTTEAEARAFFARIARTVVHHHARRQRAKKRRGDRRWTPPARTPFLFSPQHLNDWTPEDRLLWMEGWRVFWRRAVKTMELRPCGRRDLSIFHLYTIEGWSSREIASKLDGALKPSSVLSVVHRVRRQLGSSAWSRQLAA